MHSEMSAVASGFFLFAEVRANLLQLEPDSGHGVTTGPEMLAREVPLFPAQSGYDDGALPFQKSSTTRWDGKAGNGKVQRLEAHRFIILPDFALFLEHSFHPWCQYF